MVDRQDIDALLISALYGELTPADEARLTMHLESHPADMEEWDLPAAYEALARGHSLAGELDEARRYVDLGRQATSRIEDADDRAPLEADFATIRT